MATGTAIRTALRTRDALARLGGDEFGILLPDTNGEDAAQVLARVQTSLQHAMATNDWHVNFSMGHVTWQHGDANAAALLSQADEAMYRAKRAAKLGS
jgi:diguanylate cyclase (GGDEF)-like protein